MKFNSWIALLGSALGASAQASGCGGVGFLLVGDQGTRTSIQTSIAQSLNTVAGAFNPTAVLGLGDNIYENGPQGSNALIKSSFDDIYLGYANLRKRWNLVMGNHDWYSDARLEVNYSIGHQNWILPGYYYKKSYSGNGYTIDFFFIDTMIWMKSSQSGKYVSRTTYKYQKDWLTKNLGRSTATWKVVVGHHPPYSAGYHGVNTIIRDEVMPIMRTYKAQIFVGGHDHDSQLIKYLGQYIIVAGAAGKGPRPPSGQETGTLLEYINNPSFVTLEFCSASTAMAVYYQQDGSVKSTQTLNNEGSSIGVASSTDLVKGVVMAGWSAVPVVSSCSGKTLRDVEGICGDSCTVQVDTRFDDTCEDYCTRNRLQCVAGWVHADVGPVFGIRCNRQRTLACDEARSQSDLGEAEPSTETMLVCKCG